jgi:hypothetical protein
MDGSLKAFGEYSSGGYRVVTRRTMKRTLSKKNDEGPSFVDGVTERDKKSRADSLL